MKEQLREIVELTGMAGTQPTMTALPGVALIKGEVPQHQLAAIYEPMIGFTVQGKKTLSIGKHIIHAPGPSYYIIPTDIPATAQVHQGKNGLAYLSIGLRLNLHAVQDLLKDYADEESEEPPHCGFAACPMTEKPLDAWLRLLRLLKAPRDIPALAAVYEREILYRALQGPQGWQLRQLCFADGSAGKIHKTIQWIREHYTQPIDIGPLAEKSGMAVTTFHRQFKQITGLSPVQFQKQLRLLEARKLLIYEGCRAADAAFSVGYESASQFNREYSRHFGASPAQDAQRIRQLNGASPHASAS